MNLPNYLTLARILSVPFLIWLIDASLFHAAFWVFLLAGISDGLDGYLARRLNLVSRLGAYLDPIADKALLVAVYVTLGVVGLMPGWLVITIVARDIMIVAAVGLAAFLGNPFEIRPLWISKATTTVQMVFAIIVLSGPGLGVEAAPAEALLVPLVAMLTFASAVTYLSSWIRHMGRM